MSSLSGDAELPCPTPYAAAATTDDILACFRLLLGRAPNPEEWTGHAALAGQDLSRVVSNYLRSAEFSARGLTDAALPEDVRLATLNGCRIYASASDEAVGRHVVGGEYEPYLADLFRHYLRPGMTVVDVGANIGVFALLAASLVGAGGYVLAVEPNPANARLLEASRLENGFAQMTTLQAAAADAPGIMVLNSFDSNGTTTRVEQAQLLTAQTVCAVRLDDIIGARQVDLVKIDVEGAEYGALRGLQSALLRCKPVLFSEFSPGQLVPVSGIDGPGYLNWLTGIGYRLGVIHRDGPPSRAGLSVDEIMAQYSAANLDHIDIFGLPA